MVGTEVVDLKVGDTVWYVERFHTFDAFINNRYWPAHGKITEVCEDVIWVDDSFPLQKKKCFLSKEDCQAACPEDHEDD